MYLSIYKYVFLLLRLNCRKSSPVLRMTTYTYIYLSF